jgi:hypothetical protein
MDFSEYTFNAKPENNGAWLVLVSKKDGIKFSSKIVHRNGQPPAELIFNLFINNKQMFCVEV